MTGSGDGDEARVRDDGFRALLEKLSASYNFDFRQYKEASLERRIRARMAQVHAETFAAYAGYLDRQPREHVALFNTILINVTGFFRDPEAWKVLAETVVPRLVDTQTLRVWCAGCSSGEEAYSVAMLLAEHLGERVSAWTIKVYGTDVDEEALAAARHATYRSDALRDVPDALVQRHFVREGQSHRVRRELRRWCIFGSHNVVQAPPLSHIDLLVCRNVLIYFTSELQERVLARFHYALREDGVLFLGRSESTLARSGLFASMHPKWRIFRRTSPTTRTSASCILHREDSAETAGPARTDVPGTTGHAQQALDGLPLAVMVVDTTDTVLVWNAAAEHLFDIPVGGALRRKFRDLDVSYRIEGLRVRLEEAKTRQTASRMDDATFTRRNGELVHADIAIVPLLEAGRLVGVLVSAGDATEGVRLREQLTRVAEQHATAIEELQSTNEELETTNEELQSTNEELETTIEELQSANAELGALNMELEARTAELNRLDTYHHSILDSLEEGVLAVDRSLVVRSWNAVVQHMWGLTADQVLGRPFASLPLGSAPEAVVPTLQRVVDGGVPEEVLELAYTVPGGGSRPARLRVVPLNDGSGATIGAVAVLASAADSGRGLASST